MRNRIIVRLLAVLALLVGLAVGAAAEAKDITWGRQAAAVSAKGWPGGSIEFTRYLGGTTRYITFWCDSESRYGSIYPGQWSKNEGSCADVGGVYVESGSKLACGERYGLASATFYPGWHDIGNFRYWACEKRAYYGGRVKAARDITWGKIKALRDITWGRQRR